MLIAYEPWWVSQGCSAHHLARRHRISCGYSVPQHRGSPWSRRAKFDGHSAPDGRPSESCSGFDSVEQKLVTLEIPGSNSRPRVRLKQILRPSLHGTTTSGQTLFDGKQQSCTVALRRPGGGLRQGDQGIPRRFFFDTIDWEGTDGDSLHVSADGQFRNWKDPDVGRVLRTATRLWRRRQLKRHLENGVASADEHLSHVLKERRPH
jgi:hypothetical protein